MPNTEFIGRRVSVGFGIESTYGTEVAPVMWPKQTKLGLQRKITRIENESAMGRNEGSNDSAIVEEWAEGPIEGKVYDQTVGYLLYNIFGTKVTTTNADSSTTVKDHTFTVSTSNVAPTLTLTRYDPVTCRRHGMGTLDGLDITSAARDWVKLSAPIKAKYGVTSSDTAAYAAENAFTNKHVTVKLATNLAGLAGATAITTKSFKLSIKRVDKPYFAHGSIDPSAFNTGKWTADGEIVLRYGDTTLETLAFANTIQALSISLKNTDVVIGTSTNPSLVFTAPRVRLNTFNMSDGLDDIVEQTVGFTCEFSIADGYMLQAVLTNTKASY